MYEQRIEELEGLVTSKGDKSESNRHTTVAALEKDLAAAREQHRKKQQEQQSAIDSLREEVSRLKHKSAGSNVLKYLLICLHLSFLSRICQHFLSKYAVCKSCYE